MDPEEYIEALPEPRRTEIRRLDALIRETLPDAERGMEGSFLGYGPFHYRYPSGREGDTHLVSLASRSNGISLYVLCARDGRYLAEEHAERLGKADVGKSCVRFKRVDDLELDGVRELLREAGRLGGAGAA